jgi:hypothetical protein
VKGRPARSELDGEANGGGYWGSNDAMGKKSAVGNEEEIRKKMWWKIKCMGPTRWRRRHEMSPSPKVNQSFSYI